MGFTDKFLLDVSNKLKKDCKIILFGDQKEVINNRNDYDILINREKFFNSRDIDQQIKNYEKFLKINFSHFQDLELLFYKLSDRMFINSKPNRSLRKYYLSNLIYWLEFFENNKDLNLVLFESLPHFPFEIVPYYVAKYYKAKVYSIKTTHVPHYIMFDKSLQGFVPDYEKISFSKSENKKFIEKFIKEGIPRKDWSKKNISEKVNQAMLVDYKNNFFRYLKSRLFSFGILREYLKKLKKGYFQLSYYQGIVAMIKRDFQKFRLRNWLQKNSIIPDLKKNYIYFALHYQPERSTDPEAIYFTDQVMAIELLAYNLPEDYYIYVKEHPRQYNDNFPDIKKTHFREIEDYERIKKIKNVILITPSDNAKNLIDNCKFTASCNGTNIFEGLQESKPGIVFGKSWLSSCKSVLNVNKIDNLKNYINIIISKNREIVKKDFIDFLNLSIDYGVVSVVTERLIDHNQVDRKVLINNLLLAIKELIEKDQR